MKPLFPTPELPPDLGLAFRELAAARLARRWAWLVTGTQTMLLLALWAALGVGASARAGIWMVTAPPVATAGRAAEEGGWLALAAAVVTAGLTVDELGHDGAARAAEWLAPPVAAAVRARLVDAKSRLGARPVTQTFIPVAATEGEMADGGERAAVTVTGYLLVALPAHQGEAARVERRPYAVDLVAEARGGGRWQVVRWEETER